MSEANVNTNVIYAVLDPTAEDGYRKIGQYRMLVPPRINETITCQDELRGPFGRFKVLEVVHNLPAMGLPDLVTDCVVLLQPVFTSGDRARALAAIAKRDDHTGRSRLAH